MSCGVGHRHGWGPALLWLRHRPAATVPIGCLAWEPPYTESAALKKNQKTKNKNKIKPGRKICSACWYLDH